MGIYDHMSGHLDNCTGQTSIWEKSYILESEISGTPESSKYWKTEEYSGTKEEFNLIVDLWISALSYSFIFITK
jgi:hypothetical protein